jgi:hypothetical protein
MYMSAVSGAGTALMLTSLRARSYLTSAHQLRDESLAD